MSRYVPRRSMYDVPPPRVRFDYIFAWGPYATAYPIDPTGPRR